jgi:hypothetical protein
LHNNFRQNISSCQIFTITFLIGLVARQVEKECSGFVDMVAENAQEFLQRLALQQKTKREIDPSELDTEALRKEVIDLRAENVLLIKIAENIQSHLSSQVLSISTELKEASELLERSHLFKERMAEKISVLGDAFVQSHSDLKFAKLLYGRTLSINHFKNGIRGVLLLKRGRN